MGFGASVPFHGLLQLHLGGCAAGEVLEDGGLHEAGDEGGQGVPCGGVAAHQLAIII